MQFVGSPQPQSVRIHENSKILHANNLEPRLRRFPGSGMFPVPHRARPIQVTSHSSSTGLESGIGSSEFLSKSTSRQNAALETCIFMRAYTCFDQKVHSRPRNYFLYLFVSYESEVNGFMSGIPERLSRLRRYLHGSLDGAAARQLAEIQVLAS